MERTTNATTKVSDDEDDDDEDEGDSGATRFSITMGKDPSTRATMR